MKKTTKNWLIIALILIVLGGIIFVGVMMKLKWDFSKIATNKYVDNFYEITEEFQNISIDINTADVEFVLTEDGKCKVECHEDSKEVHSVTIQEDTLYIKKSETKHWYDNINLNFGSTKITVYVPKEVNYNNINILLSTGDVYISNIVCNGTVDLKLSTGAINVSNVRCQNFKSASTTGDSLLKNVLVVERLKVRSHTGDITIIESDADKVYITNGTGDVVGEFLSGKDFVVQTSTGEVNVPRSSGGQCMIITSTGDIKIDIVE